MSAIELPEHLRQFIDRQVAGGRADNAVTFLTEAVHRYAQELDAEDAVVAAAEAGVRDIEAGGVATIASAEDAEALHARVMQRVRERLGLDGEH